MGLISPTLRRSSTPPNHGSASAWASAALRAVPEQYRKVFLLSLEGFTYHEIAEMLGVPMGTLEE